jgi:hypothetical protein
MIALVQLEHNIETEYFQYVTIREEEKTRNPSDLKDFMLTRGLVGFALKSICNCSEDKIKKHIVDGFGDNGIDGIYYDPLARKIYLIQSKWVKDPNSGIDLGDMEKFLSGAKDLFSFYMDRFHNETKSLSNEINAALMDANTRAELLIITTSQQPLSVQVKMKFDDFVKEQNIVHDFANYELYGIKNLHEILKNGYADKPIDSDVLFQNWVEVLEPAKAIIGTVSAIDLANLYKKNGKQLLAPNIRYFLGNTEVNDSIISTTKDEPKNFWYYNNGITAICRQIIKKPIGGASHSTGIFECNNMFIINGAQTVGSLLEAQNNQIDLSNVFVQLRIIEVSDTNNAFGKNITKNNNTQNRVDSRDFVALDKTQERIYEELILENVLYAFKSGDVIPDGMNGFRFEEAAISLACYRIDIDLMVQAKREVSKLWANLEKPPYKLLFNSSTDSIKLWKIVKIMKVVEAWINEKGSILTGRDKLLLYHGNRFLLLLVYEKLKERYDPEVTEIVKDEILKTCDLQFERLKNAVEKLYSDSQLANLFKNKEKCILLYNEKS